MALGQNKELALERLHNDADVVATETFRVLMSQQNRHEEDKEAEFIMSNSNFHVPHA